MWKKNENKFFFIGKKKKLNLKNLCNAESEEENECNKESAMTFCIYYTYIDPNKKKKKNFTRRRSFRCIELATTRRNILSRVHVFNQKYSPHSLWILALQSGFVSLLLLLLLLKLFEFLSFHSHFWQCIVSFC